MKYFSEGGRLYASRGAYFSSAKTVPLWVLFSSTPHCCFCPFPATPLLPPVTVLLPCTLLGGGTGCRQFHISQSRRLWWRQTVLCVVHLSARITQSLQHRVQTLRTCEDLDAWPALLVRRIRTEHSTVGVSVRRDRSAMSIGTVFERFLPAALLHLRLWSRGPKGSTTVEPLG